MTRLIALASRVPTRARAPRATVDRWGQALVTLIVLCWCASLVIGFETALAILTIVGFAAAIVGTFQPVLGLLGIGLLCTLDFVMNAFLFPGGLLRWNTFNYWLVLAALTSVPLLLKQRTLQYRLMQVVAVLLSLEVLVSPDWYRGLQDVAGIAAAFGLVVYFARVSDQASVWYWLGVICGTTGAAGGLAFFIQQASLPSVNPNAWAFGPLTALFAICVAFPVARLWRRDPVVLVMLAAANYALVFLSASRGTLLTATACGLFLLVQAHRVRGGWLVALTAVLVAVALTSQFTDLQAHAVNRIRLLLNPQQSLVNRTSGRSDLLVSGWNIFLDHPLGVGTGGFAVSRVDLNLARGQLSGWRSQEKKDAHTGWIKVLAENGLPGIALMGAYVLSFAVTGWRSRNRDLFLLGLLVTWAFSLGFISTEYQSKGLWFLAAAVTVLLNPGSVLARNAPRSE